MASSNSRSEYESRMHRVVAYIDEHLDQPLDLGTLAEVANFSPFHFHRLFSAWMGETLGDYMRRRRVELAAMRLAAQPRSRVLNIALSTGFGSAEAFTRAFKSRFGCSPTAWRANEVAQRRAKRNPDQVKARRVRRQPLFPQNMKPPQPEARRQNMNVKLIDRQPATIAYLRYVGPYGQGISEFWRTATTHGPSPTTYSTVRATASAMTTSASPRPSNAVTTPALRSRPSLLLRVARRRQPSQAAAMPCFPSRAMSSV